MTVFKTDEPKGDSAAFSEIYKSKGGREFAAAECDYKCDILVD